MKRPLTRLAAVIGSAIIGLVGAVALSSPAQAHHTTITGVPQCADDGILITWTVQNWETSMTAELIKVEASQPSPLSTIVDGATLPGGEKTGHKWNYGKLVGTQLVPFGTSKASLSVMAKWTNGYKRENTGFAGNLPIDCDKGDYSGEISGSAYCDTDSGTWKVTWTVANKHADKEAKVKIITPDPLDGLKTGDKIPAASSVTANQTLSGDKTTAHLKVSLSWGEDKRKKKVLKQTVQFDGSCTRHTPKPDVTFASDCTGIVTVTLANGEDATKAAEFTVTGAGGFVEHVSAEPGESVPVAVPASASSAITVTEGDKKIAEYAWRDSAECHPVSSDVTETCDGLVFKFANPASGAPTEITLAANGGEPHKFTLASGESKEIKIPAEGDELSVAVSIDGKEISTVDWEKPQNCEQPGLPVTGTGITMIVVAGVAVLGVGALLFLLARRRRITIQ